MESRHNATPLCLPCGATLGHWPQDKCPTSFRTVAEPFNSAVFLKAPNALGSQLTRAEYASS